MREILEEPSLVYYLVKKLKEKDPEKQVGKTIIQKLLFLLETKSDLDFDYTLYHYGPYSSKIGEYIDLIETLGFINVRWDPKKGYFVEPSNSESEENLLSTENLHNLHNLIEEIVDTYGKFTANQLSIIATAFYLKNKFDISSSEQLVDAVLNAKPNNKRDWIINTLIEGKVINESN